MEHRFRILLDVYNKHLSEDEAADLLKVRVRTVKQLITLHGERLRIITPLIDKLLEPVNTKHDQFKLKNKLAEQLGTTYRQINRLLSTSGITVPKPIVVIERKSRRETAQNRVTARLKAAIDVIAGLRTAEDAAESQEVTRRQIYRLCGIMLKREGLVFRDLKHMRLNHRKELVEKLEELENV